MFLTTAVLDALSVLSPVACAGCGEDDRSLCARCLSGIAPHPVTNVLDGPLAVTSALRYDDRVRRIILALKEQGRTDVSRPLAGALAVAVDVAIHGEVELATVPPSHSGYRRRGYDPVLLLLRRAGYRRPEPVLRRVRQTERQKTLDRGARGLNLIGSLRARHPLAGRRFVLVDDVMTTGATLVETARAIREGGGEVVSAATLAFTPRLYPAISSTSL